MAYAVKRVEEAEDYPYHGNYGTSSATYNRALDVTSLTPHRLTQLLLEGAVTSTVQAIAAIEMEDDAGKMASIERSILIVNSLRESLNMEKGGAIAENLEVV
ncbi:MAG: flagellar protein FliS, partial [Gammaproteobacteria bacterium]|nr:flagellar protein FliS [Gammaproteobacteria bacterium]